MPLSFRLLLARVNALLLSRQPTDPCPGNGSLEGTQMASGPLSQSAPRPSPGSLLDGWRHLGIR